MGRAPRRRLAGGGDGGAWLDGDAARGVACDASLTPVVTGEVDPAVLEDIVRLSVQLDKLRRHDHHHHHGDRTGDGGGSGDVGGSAAEGTGTGGGDRTGVGTGDRDGSAAEDAGDGSAAEGTGGGAAAPASAAGAPDPGAARAREALEQAIIGKTMNLLVHFENLP